MLSAVFAVGVPAACCLGSIRNALVCFADLPCLRTAGPASHLLRKVRYAMYVR